MSPFAPAALLALLAVAQEPHDGGLRWRELPPLAYANGLAGTFAGVAGDALLVAGGADFPDAPPWGGGAKVWHDDVWLLTEPDGAWSAVGRLPAPRAYGVSFAAADGVLCVGGSDDARCFADCWLLRWDGTALALEPWPALPTPLAQMAGAVVGHEALVVGGVGAPDDATALRTVYALDLERPEEGWTEREPLPGPGRILAVAAERSGALYVFSGAALSAGTNGGPVREYLTDAWSFRHGAWSARAGPPRALVAAPSPAPAVGASHVLVLGGDDGALVGFEPRAQHPGFPREVLTYDAVTDTWTAAGELPAELRSPVTTPVVRWRGEWVVPTGEVRPGVRAPQVFALDVTARRAAFGALDWGVVALYLLGMLGVGFWFLRRETSGSTEAYFRGGQRVPVLVAGLSIFATMLSALTFMGIPARAYQTDVSWYVGQLPILLIAPLVAFCYLPFFRRLDLTSAYEYLERRFDLRCRLFASVSFMLFHVGRIALVLYLPALALAAVSDVPVVAAVLVLGLLCLVYTVIGGIEAVVWTDAVQALVLLGGAGLCLALATGQVDGGFAGVLEIARRDHKLFESLSWTSLDVREGTTSVLVLFAAFFFNSLVPYTSSQDVVQRYVTTRDLPAARRSLWVTMWMSVFGSMVFFALGVALYAFYRTHPAELDPALPASDSILPYFVMRELPSGVSGLVIAAVFAASQSTVSSSLNSIATAYVTDLDARVLRPGRPDRAVLRTARVAVVVAGVLGTAAAVWMASARIESAFRSFNSLIGLTAGSLGGLFALGVFTRRTNGAGALVGAVLGLATVLGLRLAGAPVSGLLYALIGFGVSFFAGWALSLALRGRSDPSLSWRSS